MASDTPPTGAGPGGLPDDDDFELEFDPADELEPSNEFVDVVLTRAGELTLDLIEGVQEHPVLAASLFAAAIGALAGLVAAALVPRRPSAKQRAALAAERAEAAALPAQLTRAQRRLGETLETAGAGLRSRRLLGDGVLGGLRRRVEEAEIGLPPGLGTDGQRMVGDTRGAAWRRAQAARQLLPVAMELLRNEIVRDLLAHALASRVRRSVRL